MRDSLLLFLFVCCCFVRCFVVVFVCFFYLLLFVVFICCLSFLFVVCCFYLLLFVLFVCCFCLLLFLFVVVCCCFCLLFYLVFCCCLLFFIVVCCFYLLFVVCYFCLFFVVVCCCAESSNKRWESFEHFCRLKHWGKLDDATCLRHFHCVVRNRYVWYTWPGCQTSFKYVILVKFVMRDFGWNSVGAFTQGREVVFLCLCFKTSRWQLNVV
jgi:hypothetical protein